MLCGGQRRVGYLVGGWFAVLATMVLLLSWVFHPLAASTVAQDAPATVGAHDVAASAYTYDGAAHSVRVHTSAVALGASYDVAESRQGTVATVAGHRFVVLPKSVAANTADELGAVATHLDSIDALASHPPNAAMVNGIQDAISSGRGLSPGEQYFMTHELTEAEAVANGLSQDAAHAAALGTHPPFMNYTPEVIQRFPEYFNSNWRNAWGIG